MTAWARTSYIVGMSIAPSRTDHEPGAGGLVEMEHELTRLLIEYDELRTAWPTCRTTSRGRSPPPTISSSRTDPPVRARVSVCRVKRRGDDRRGGAGFRRLTALCRCGLFVNLTACVLVNFTFDTFVNSADLGRKKALILPFWPK